MLKCSIFCFLIILCISNFAQSGFNNIWANQTGNDYVSSNYRLTIDQENSVISVLYLFHSVDVNPGPETSMIDAGPSGQRYIRKLNSDGDYQWCKRIYSSSNTCNINEITTDNDGNIFITGYFNNTVNFNPGGAGGSLAAHDGMDIFLLKLNTDGDFLWVKRFGLIDDQKAYDIAVNRDGEIALTGVYSGTIVMQLPDAGTDTLETSLLTTDLFLMKLDPDGNMLWGHGIGSYYIDTGVETAFDNQGNVIVTGRYKGNVDFDPSDGTAIGYSSSEYDIYIAKYNFEGNFVWLKTYAQGSGANIHSFQIDGNDNIISMGRLNYDADLDPGDDEYEVEAIDGFAAYVQKLSPEGDFIWAKTWYYNSTSIMSIDTDEANNIYVSSHFSESIDLDPGEASAIFFDASTISGRDFFYVVLNPAGEYMGGTTLGGLGKETVHYISVGIDGALFAVGSFEGTVDFAPDADEYILTSVGSQNTFTQKLSFDGLGLSTLDESKIHIYPNPIENNINIVFDHPTNYQLNIMTLDGKKLFTEKGNTLGHLQFELDAPSGIYILVLQSDNGYYVNKLIKK